MRDHTSSQLSPEEYDTPITWALSPIVSTQSRGERPGECLMELQSTTLPLNEGGILHQAKSLTEVLELRLDKWFGEDICNLLVYRKILYMYCFPLHHISDVMIFDLDVFRFIVKHKILLRASHNSGYRNG
jgi:hypothetical protein